MQSAIWFKPHISNGLTHFFDAQTRERAPAGRGEGLGLAPAVITAGRGAVVPKIDAVL